jgi:hypothetical protein
MEDAKSANKICYRPMSREAQLLNNEKVDWLQGKY